MTETNQGSVAGQDSVVVRQITQYQFTWRAADEAHEPGSHLLQLILDEGASEEVLTVNPVDSVALQLKLAAAPAAFYDQRTGSIVTSVSRVGAGLAAAAAAAD